MNESGLFSDRRVHIGILAVLFLLAAFLAVSTLASLKGLRYIGGGVPITNVVTVSGEGEVFAVPDIATFTFGVIEHAATVDAAQKTAKDKINASIEYLKEQGIEEKDIRTIGYNVYPRYQYTQEVCTSLRCPPGRQVLDGFEVTQTIEVKVRDPQKAGTLLSGVGEFGATNVSGLTFTIDDEEELLAQARAMAIEDAREKAEQLADDLDVRLVRVVNFSEGGAPIPYFYAKERAAMNQGGGVAMDMATAESAPAIPVGENQIKIMVSVTYEIR